MVEKENTGYVEKQKRYIYIAAIVVASIVLVYVLYLRGLLPISPYPTYPTYPTAYPTYPTGLTPPPTTPSQPKVAYVGATFYSVRGTLYPP